MPDDLNIAPESEVMDLALHQLPLDNSSHRYCGPYHTLTMPQTEPIVFLPHQPCPYKPPHHMT